MWSTSPIAVLITAPGPRSSDDQTSRALPDLSSIAYSTARLNVFSIATGGANGIVW
jgi:hypothetical protein